MAGTEALLARLRAQRDFDAVLLSIGEADYGCEERRDSAPERVSLELLTPDGRRRFLEIPADRLAALGLREGALCRLDTLG